MPAAYAHLTFGRSLLPMLGQSEVYEELLRVIEENRDLFEIGLQGPDILFFYRPLSRNPISRHGFDLHGLPAEEFLRQAAARGRGEKTLAYLLGVVCHFTLDSACHSHVEYFMEKYGLKHSEIETDLERYLMVRDGLDPMRHRPSGYIQTRRELAEVIGPCYSVTGGVIREALATMKAVGWALVPRGPVRRKALLGAIGLLGEDHMARQLVIDHVPRDVFGESDRVLLDRMRESRGLAVGLMANFASFWRGEGELSDRFGRTFGVDEETLTRLREEGSHV